VPALAGCAELPDGTCIGGALTPEGFEGCMVLEEPMVGGEPATEEECANAAAAACCEHGACL
jgi:hypothetical protein